MKEKFDENLRKELLERILQRISYEKQRKMKRRFFFSMAGVILSIIVFILIWPFVYNDFVSSGFAYFLFVIFSHPALMINYLKDFALALLESLPIFGLLLLLSNLIILMIFLRLFIKIRRYSSLNLATSRN